MEKHPLYLIFIFLISLVAQSRTIYKAMASISETHMRGVLANQINACLSKTAWSGKVKRMTPLLRNKIKIEFSDVMTALNGQKSRSVVGKGAINAEISRILFEKLQEEGIESHYHSMNSSSAMICDHIDMIPLEVVIRFKACGSVVNRLGISQHTRFETPIIELFYKRDDLGDPLVISDHVLFLKIVTPKELANIYDIAMKCALKLRNILASVGIELADLKLEFGRRGGQIVVADEISPDNCRLHDMNSKDGLKSLDKDLFRFDLGDVEKAYKKVLRRIRNLR